MKNNTILINDKIIDISGIYYFNKTFKYPEIIQKNIQLDIFCSPDIKKFQQILIKMKYMNHQIMFS